MSLLPFESLPKPLACIIADYCSWEEPLSTANAICRRIFYRSDRTDVYLEFDHEKVRKVFDRIVTEKLPVITYFQLQLSDKEVVDLRLFATTTFVYHERVYNQGSRYLNLMEDIVASWNVSNEKCVSIVASCKLLGIERVVKPAEASAAKEEPLSKVSDLDAWKKSLLENYPTKEIGEKDVTTIAEDLTLYMWNDSLKF